MKTNGIMAAAVGAALLLSSLPVKARPDQGEQHRIRQLALESDATPRAPRALAVIFTATASPAPGAPSAPPAPAAPPAPSAPPAPPAPAAPPAPSAPSAPPAPPAPGSNPVITPGSVVTQPADAVPPFNPTLSQTHIKGSALMGLAVFNNRNEKLGDINDLVMELATGRVSSLIVAFDDRLALVPLTAFRYDSTLQLLHVNSTKEALKTFPAP